MDDNHRQSFTKIVPGGTASFSLKIFCFCAVVVERPRQRTAKSGDVRTAFNGVDVVHVRMHILGVLAEYCRAIS